MKGGSHADLLDQDALDQALQLETDGVVRELVDPNFDFLVGLLGISSLKGGPTKSQRIKNDSNSPDINLIRITLPIKHLRGNIVRSAAYSPLSFIEIFDLRR